MQNNEVLNKVWWPELGSDGRLWVFAGDSITHGVVHTGTERDYVELFAEHVRRLQWRELVLTTAVSGWQLTQLADNLEWGVLRHRPAVVSLMFGTNDCAEVSGTDPEKFGNDYRAILDRIAEVGDPRIILQTPPGVRPEAARDRFARLPAFADQARSVAAERGLVLVDHFAHWQQAGPAADAWYADPFQSQRFRACRDGATTGRDAASAQAGLTLSGQAAHNLRVVPGMPVWWGGRVR